MSYLLHEALDGAFRDHAARPAIREEGVEITYSELASLAAKVARMLAGGGPGDPGLCREDDRFVGLSATVTVGSAAAAIGILSAGRAYVPLDVQSPPARLAEIIADARLRVLMIDPLAYPEWEELARQEGVEAVVLLGAERPGAEPSARARLVAWSEVVALPPEAPPRRPTLADDLAYILYTSGSTGVPKGVMLTHRNARTFVDWMASEFEIGPEDRVASRAPLNFDLSVFDVFNTFAAGATLLIKDRRKVREAGKSSAERHRAYVEMLRDERATVLYTTPSTFVTLLEKGGLDGAAPLRVIMYAGEPFPPALLRKVMAALPRTRVANIYGPTETNIVTCHWVLEPPQGDTPIPIGREVADTEIEVVGEGGGRRCAPGEVGELWVRGGTVCVGYFGKDELTRERLVKSPFHPYPAYFWRTGDYGTRLPDGVLIYHGRLDSMVKTRGHRVELGDVEAALSEHADLAQAVVVPIPHPSYGSTLHAFVLPREGAAPVRPEDVMRFLEGRLPHYMLPWEILVVSEFPYTSTGKVDRQLLLRTRSSIHDHHL